MRALLSHTYVGRLSSEAKTMVNHLTKNMVKPGQILLAIKDHDQTNFSTIKTIYNERQKYRREQRRPRMEIQHMMKLIEHNEYVYWFR